MQCERQDQTGKGFSDEEIREAAFRLIRAALGGFMGFLSGKFPDKIHGFSAEREPFFNAQLCLCFQSFSRHGVVQFDIEREYTPPDVLFEKNQGRDHEVDHAISIPGAREAFLVIEGKRLHSTSDRQYVDKSTQKGNTGGIVRFKRNQHGIGHQEACMVGYVQKETASFWQPKVNAWIEAEQVKPTDLVWNENELLSFVEEETTLFVSLHSQHRRIEGGDILLHHFWVSIV